jgi:cytochrome c-type protein NapC
MGDDNIGEKRSGQHKKRKSVSRGLLFGGGAILFLAGIGSVVAFTTTFEQTTTTEFCTSCHSLQWVTAEYKQSVHYRNVSGVAAGCADCHVPKPFWPKLKDKFAAAKELMHEIKGTIDTKEKFEARRWELANRVWAEMKASDSRECRSCHDFANMDFEEQDKSARRRHARAADEGQTCIDCHKGIAHKEPEEPEAEEAERSAAVDGLSQDSG